MDYETFFEKIKKFEKRLGFFEPDEILFHLYVSRLYCSTCTSVVISRTDNNMEYEDEDGVKRKEYGVSHVMGKTEHCVCGWEPQQSRMGCTTTNSPRTVHDDKVRMVKTIFHDGHEDDELMREEYHLTCIERRERGEVKCINCQLSFEKLTLQLNQTCDKCDKCFFLLCDNYQLRNTRYCVFCDDDYISKVKQFEDGMKGRNIKGAEKKD